MKPHKHADLIKAWADGAEIEVKSEHTCHKWELHKNPAWVEGHEYRIKPEPKPVSIYTYHVQWGPRTNTPHWHQSALHNLKLTFDGETGKLKSAEVIND